MPKKIRWTGVSLIGLVATLSLFFACGGGGGETSTSTPKNTSTPSLESTPTKKAPPVRGENIAVSLVGSPNDPYRFSSSPIIVEAGKIYEVVLSGGEEFHTFTVPSLGININVQPREYKAFDLKVDKPGTYKLICTSHERLGMTSKITVR